MKQRVVKVQRIAGETLPAFDSRVHSVADELALWRDLTQRSLYHFILYAMGALAYCKAHPTEDWLVPKIHIPFCDWLQEKGDGWLEERHTLEKPVKLIGLLPRNSAKSVIGTCGFPCYLHVKAPELASAIDSCTMPMSVDFMSMVQRVFSGAGSIAWFPEMFGNWEPLNDDRARSWTAKSFTHALRMDLERKDPSFKAIAVGVGLTGYHPDTVHGDDWITEEKLKADVEWPKKCREHAVTILPAMQQNGLLSYMATRYTDDDPPRHWMLSEGVRDLREPVKKMRLEDYNPDPVNGQWHVFFAPGRDTRGKPVYPKVWSEARMQEYAEKHPLRYARDVALEPSEGGYHPVTSEMMEGYWVKQDDVPHIAKLRIVFNFDTAFKDPNKRNTGDDNVILVSGHTTDGSGIVYFLEAAISPAWTDIEYMDQVALLLQKYHALHNYPCAITDELVVGKRGSFRTLLASHLSRYRMPCPYFVEIARGGSIATKNKGRLNYGVSFWASGFARVVRGAPGMAKLVAQILSFPDKHEGHDDVIDAANDTWKAPEIYKGARLLANVARAPERPYDGVLRGGNPRAWTTMQAQEVYDGNRHRERTLARRALQVHQARPSWRAN